MSNLRSDLENCYASAIKSNLMLKNELDSLNHKVKDQSISFAKYLITIMDSFERIEETIEEKGWNKVEEGLKVMNRYAGVRLKIETELNRLSVNKILFPEDKAIFGLCEIVGTEPHSELEEGTIISVIREGYVMNENEIIREAQLIVVKN